MGTARLVHMAACYWGFVLMALHWDSTGDDDGKTEEVFRNDKIIQDPLCALSDLRYRDRRYGLYVFVTRDLAAYMFLRTQFVFLDYSESPRSFYIDYLAMMGLFIWIAHYLSAILQKSGKKRDFLRRTEKQLLKRPKTKK